MQELWLLPFSKTENGFESQFGINFLGHFLLINLLFPFLLKSDAARVITLGSLAYKKGKIDFNNLNDERSYSKWNAYSQSKLACIMFAYELDRRIKQHGLPVKSVSAHPGFSQTNLAHSSPTLIKSVFNPAADLIGQGAVEGSLPILMAALSSNVAGGEYFGPTGFMEVRGEPGIVKSSTYSHDEKLAQKLWEKSEELTGRTFSVVR